MKREQIEPFLNKEIKLVQYPNFVLTGTIEEVFEDCIRFRTTSATSVIDTKAIKEISLEGGF